VAAGTYSVKITIDDNVGSGYQTVGPPHTNTVTLTFTVTQEDAYTQYSGDAIGLLGANLTLQATVWDSAASGYTATPGHPAEPGGTIGDITHMVVEFDIYNSNTCMTGTPSATKYASVVDTGTAGDGIGTATTTYTVGGTTDTTICVRMTVVDDTNAANGTTNAWYSADESFGAATFYNNTGQFVTGGGWLPDGASSNGKANFGFNARYNKNGQPQGQFVYVWRGTYGGVPADFIIKSNSLTALGFTVTGTNAYPMTATLQGKSNIQVNRSKDGVQLASLGNIGFIATATDSGLPSSNSGDMLSLSIDANSLASKSFGNTQLGGGNIVIHMK
jgi:hypothetical protein